jgi:hypothetical protein
MEQSVSLYPALLSFLSFGAVLILQRPKSHSARKLWLVSANDAYRTRGFAEFHRIRREIGEDIKGFFILHEDANSPEQYRIELPSGRQDTITKQWVDLALRKKVLVDFDPETRRRQQARILSYRRARQIRAKGWSVRVCQLVMDGKIAIEMTQEQVLMAWGKPDQIKRSRGDWAAYEQWVYGSTYLYFERGILNNYLERPEGTTH